MQSFSHAASLRQQIRVIAGTCGRQNMVYLQSVAVSKWCIASKGIAIRVDVGQRLMQMPTVNCIREQHRVLPQQPDSLDWPPRYVRNECQV